jgi:hypothetical protein
MTSMQKLCALIEWGLVIAFVLMIVFLMAPLGE